MQKSLKRIKTVEDVVTKVFHIGHTYYACTDDYPERGDFVITKNLQGKHVVDVAKRKLTAKDCYTGAERKVWVVVDRF